ARVGRDFGSVGCAELFADLHSKSFVEDQSQGGDSPAERDVAGAGCGPAYDCSSTGGRGIEMQIVNLFGRRQLDVAACGNGLGGLAWWKRSEDFGCGGDCLLGIDIADDGDFEVAFAEWASEPVAEILHCEGVHFVA